TSPSELLGERREIIRIDRKIEKSISGQARPGFELPKAVRQTLEVRAEIRAMIEQVVSQLTPAIISRSFVSELGQGFAEISPEPIGILAARGNADNGEIGGKVTASPQAVQRRQDFARGQVAADAEDNEGKRLGTPHGRHER